MPFYFRKSVSVGPFRLNLSGSGVGMSVGVRGFRVGTGPRGNYVRVGTGSIYYQQTIPHTMPPPALLPAGSPVAMTQIESAGAAQIVDATSEELLAELRQKRVKMRLFPFALALTILGLLFTKAPMIALIVGLAAMFAARYRDRMATTTVLLYDLEPAVEQAFSRFTEWAEAMAACRGKWHIAERGRAPNRKYHAGASALVSRGNTTIGIASPPHVVTNVPVFAIGAGEQTLYFLPDRLLVYDRYSIGAVSYKSLNVTVTNKRFIEEGGVPADAQVVDRTWRYVNRDGGPDRRFNHNPQIPICLYDELHLHTTSGLNEIVQLSRTGIGAGFAAALRHLGAVTP